MAWLQRWRKERAARPGSVWLDREDSERRDQFVKAVRQVRISRSLLKLAWTAGPVTAIGLYGGYYIGFGKPPSTELLIYFISFTILSGLIALVAKVIYDSVHGPELEQAEQDVMDAIDKLGELILAVRDLIVDSFEGEARRQEAALQLLQRVDLPPDGVAFACEELTGDAELGKIMAQIDIFRRAGLYSRIRDLHQQYQTRFDEAVSPLQLQAPQAAKALRDNFMGHAPKLKNGTVRSDFFVERVLAAIEQDDPLLMTMGDVEAMLVLAFELINGRELPMLIFDYTGKWRLAAVLDRMERRRSRYRIAQAASSNRIRALAAWLVEVEVICYGDASEGLSTHILTERVLDAMDALSNRLDDSRQRYQQGEVEALRPLREDAELLSTALRLYRTAHDAYKRVGPIHAEFLSATRAWERLMTRSKNEQEQLQVGPGRRGLRIIEKVISLDEDQRREVCQHVARYLHGVAMEKADRRFFIRRDGRKRPLSLDSARQLAVEVALALEPHVQLSRPEIQRGIGATNASYLGDLEPGMSAQEKKDLGEAVAQDVEQDMSQAAERLALALVRHYRVDLTDEACEFLAQTYGARSEVLAMLAHNQTDESAPYCLLSVRPAVVPAPRMEWYRKLVRARRLLT
ncbi:MAG: hypothetical protein K0A95_05855 [Chromatiales bacterium]|nr:hypothetical protein [Gammaproteobacteria bacterium]MBW6476578.1 hypothetical protein [Chromatiales bacterium]